MRIPCPHCGERGNEEFAYFTAADRVRPEADAPLEAWHDYVYLRANPAGPHRELWQHVHGCRRWLLVTRDTRTHAISGAKDAMEAELRHILADALPRDKKPEPNLAEAIRRRFAPLGGAELEPHPAVAVRDPPAFDE